MELQAPGVCPQTLSHPSVVQGFINCRVFWVQVKGRDFGDVFFFGGGPTSLETQTQTKVSRLEVRGHLLGKSGAEGSACSVRFHVFLARGSLGFRRSLS